VASERKERGENAMEAEETCLVSGCTRPKVDQSPGVCALHTEARGAGNTLGEWQYAGELLEPMIEIAELGCAVKLVEVLEEVRDLIEDEISLWESEEKRLRDEL
jgi:hypothetical protein